MNSLRIALVLTLFISCTIEKKEDGHQPEVISNKSGKEIFNERCIACHGANGKLGFGGAKDLTVSTKTKEEIIHQVTNGKGAMAPFKNILSTDEIMEVSAYAMSFRNK